MNDILEDTYTNYFKTTPAFNITGSLFYTNIKSYILNTLKKNKIKFKIINCIKTIIKEKENKEDIIYMIRLNNHVSILLKFDETFISLDTSVVHSKLLQKAINTKDNKFKFLFFIRPIQNNGTCSFYSIKFLEQIMNMEKNDIINGFNNGSLLIKVILSMNAMFTSLENRNYISTNVNEINSENKISINIDNCLYYIDDYFYLNKFVKVKSLYICLNKEIPENINFLS